MTLLSAVRAAIPGVAVTAVVPAGAGGDTFPVGNVRLLVVNASGGSTNITITTPASDKYGGAVVDPVTAVPDASAKVFGPFDADLGDANGLVKVVSSVTSGVTMYLIA